MPQTSAPSVPGRGATCRSAFSAVPVRYGSTTTSLAPRFFAAIACCITLTWVLTGLPPQITTRSACSAASRRSTPRLAPTPAIQPVSERVTQMVENQREYFIAWRRRWMPSRCTSPIVPA